MAFEDTVHNKSLTTNIQYTTGGSVDYIHNNLEYLRELLGVDQSIPLKCISRDGIRDYMSTKKRDKLIQVFPPFKNGVIRTNSFGIHDPNVDVIGVRLFETTNGVRYLQCGIGSKAWNNVIYDCVVLRADNVFRYTRHVTRLDKLTVKKPIRPILDNGIVDKIVERTIGFIKKSKQYASFGVKPKRGFIFNGDPGNGKSLLCKYLSGLALQKNIDVHEITSTMLNKAYQEDGLSQLFNKRGLLFFDDIDINYLSRKHDGKMACSILSAMDGLSKHSARICIFTTNEDLNDLDPAFVRPGRIDFKYIFNNPHAELRKQFVHTWHKEILNNLNIDDVVKATEDFSFAKMDHLKTLLVVDHLETGEWNLSKAIDDANEKPVDKKRFAGFRSWRDI